MKIFIGKISSELDSDTVYNHFKTFGEIDNFNFKNQFAFVEYKSDSDANKVLDMREIEIRGTYVIVEASNSKPRSRSDYNDAPRRDYNDAPRYDDRPPRDDYRAPRYDDRPPRDDYRAPRYDDRPPRYDDRAPRDDYRAADPYPPRHQSGGYDDYRGAPPSRYGSTSGYESRTPAYKDDYSRGSSRDDCYHCSKCEIHENPRSNKPDSYEHKKPRREHPNDVNKIVIQGIPEEANLADVDDFVRRNDFDFVFSRLTIKRDAAIVEFRDIETRDKAIQKLNNQELKGVTVLVREFRISGSFQGGQSSYQNNYQQDRQEDGNNQENKDDTWGNTTEKKDDSWGATAQTDNSWGTTAQTEDAGGWGEPAKNEDSKGVDIYSGIDK